jgi:prepilin peptidase CpaA
MTWSAIAWVLGCFILVSLLIASITDLANRIIPNHLVLVVLCCSVGLRLVSRPSNLLMSLSAAIAVLGMLSLLATYNALGWGDVKLIASVSFVVPPARVVPLLIDISIAGGVLSCIYLIARIALQRAPSTLDQNRPNATWKLGRLAYQEGARILANEPMPYAFAVLGGVAYGMVA